MATSFLGWLNSWGDSWGQLDTTPGVSRLKYWNGMSWIEKPLKRWNGTTWETKTLKLWNGVTWG